MLVVAPVVGSLQVKVLPKVVKSSPVWNPNDQRLLRKGRLSKSVLSILHQRRNEPEAVVYASFETCLS